MPAVIFSSIVGARVALNLAIESLESFQAKEPKIRQLHSELLTDLEVILESSPQVWVQVMSFYFVGARGTIFGTLIITPVWFSVSRSLARQVMLGLRLFHGSSTSHKLLLRQQMESVLAAVRRNGKALKYANTKLKKDDEIVLAAVQHDGSALKYANAELRDDKIIVLAAVKKHENALSYAGAEMKKYKAIVLAAVQKYCRAHAYAYSEMKKNEMIVLAAVMKCGTALEHAEEKMKKDKEVVLTAMQQET